MEVFDKGVEEFFLGKSSHLTDNRLGHPGKIELDGGLIEAWGIRFFALDQGIDRGTALGRELNMAGPLQCQQERATDHIAQLSIGLDPIPCLTELLGESPAAVCRILRDEAPDQGDIGARNDSVSVLQLCVHDPANITPTSGTQAQSDLFRQFFEEPHLLGRNLEVPDEGL
jgi:hypothetical protein